MNERSVVMLRTATVAAVVVLLSACMASRARERVDPAQLFAAADTNGDGVVTRAEFIAARASNFTKYDRDHDGFIDTEDFPRRLRARENASQRLEDLIGRLDTDRDGRISRAEFVDGPTSAFDLADANGDGQLSKAEIDAAAKAVKDRRGSR